MRSLWKWCGLVLLVSLVVGGCASDEEKKLSHYERGVGYFDKAEYKAAEIELKNAIQIDPQYTAAHSKLAETYLKMGDAQGAFRAYSTVVQLDPDNTDALLKLATFYMLGKQFDDSRTRVDAVLGSDPENIEALYLKSGLDDIDKNLPEAAETFRRIIRLDGTQTRAYVGLARVLAQQGKMEEAESNLKKAVAVDPKDVRTRLALIGFYASRNDPAQAEREFAAAIAANPQSSELYMAQGNFHLRQKKMDAAEASVLKAVELEPGNSKRYIAAARFYETIGSTDKAREMYARALEVDADDVAVLYEVARHHFKANEIDPADSYNEKILASRPGFMPARMLKGEILIAKRDWNGALAVFDAIIAQEPKAEQAHYYKGLAHFSKGEMQVAKASLNRVIELDARNLQARLLLADIALRMRDVDSAERLSKEVIAELPDHYQAHAILGQTYLAKGQPAQAAEVFERMTALRQDDPQGYFQLGVARRMLKDDEGALAALDQALEINPKLMDVFSQIVSIYVGREDFTAAIDRCDAHLEQVKDSALHVAVISHLKGRVYGAQGKDAAAEAAYKVAIDTFENYMPPYFELAKVYWKRNDIDRAIGQYNAVLAQNPNQVQAHMLLGTLYEMQQKYEPAEQHYREALKIDPAFAPAANNLAYRLADTDRELNEALDLARLAKEKLPNDPGVMDTLGWVYYKKGLYDSAIAELNDSAEKLKDNAMVHFHLGMAYYKAGEPARAKAVLERVMALAPEFEKAEEVRAVLEKL